MEQSKLGYPYSYGNELTLKTARSNINKMLIILLLIWPLQVETAQLPPVDGFIIPAYTLCRNRQHTYSKEVTNLNIRLKQYPNNQNRL